MPEAGEVLGRAVEDDAAADEHEPLDEALDRTEFVRDVEDGDRELAMQAVEQVGERVLRLDVDAGGRLVEDEQRRLARRAPSR